MKLVKACIALAAFAALFVVPSVASASLELTAPTGTRYKGSVIATNIKLPPENKVHTLFTTNIGTVTCDLATLTGSVLTDETDSPFNKHVLGEITTAEFKGKESANCTSPVGNVTVTPNHITNPSHTPSGGVAHASLPWCITAEKEDRLLVWGRTSGETCHAPKNTQAPTFTLHTAIAGTCSYEKEIVGPLTATYRTHTSTVGDEDDAIATVDAGQTFKKITGGAFCPGTGSLDMSFTLTTDKEHKHVEPIYIDK